MQHDTVHATSGALASQTRAACRELEKRQEKTAGFRAKYHSGREPCRQDPLVDVFEQRAQQAETADRPIPDESEAIRYHHEMQGSPRTRRSVSMTFLVNL